MYNPFTISGKIVALQMNLRAEKDHCRWYADKYRQFLLEKAGWTMEAISDGKFPRIYWHPPGKKSPTVMFSRAWDLYSEGILDKK